MEPAGCSAWLDASIMRQGTPPATVVWPSSMGEVAKRLLAEALGLPEAERAELTAELLASFDGPADLDIDTAWAGEIDRRTAKILSGESQGVPWEEVRGRIEGDLRRR